MNSLPTIAIVGRPNVGKSSLLNRIVGRRHAIVDPTPGVTRDRNYAEAIWNGRRFNVVDTGGLDPDDKQPIQKAIRQQVEFALREADAIILACDGKQGLYHDDRVILELLRKSCGNKPIFVAVNKLDNPLDESALAEFYSLGAHQIYPISALHGHGVADLLDAIVEPFPRNASNASDQVTPSSSRIAIVGKPNVGKSTLFNRLIGQERSIVDDAPGTTRDTIVVPIERAGKTYYFFDTAGLRRPSRRKDSIEFYSVFRTLDAIKKSDIAMLVIDASAGEITQQDKRIADRIIEVGSGCLILLNKWDIAPKDEKLRQHIQKSIREQFPLLEFAPIITCSAHTGLRVDKVFEYIERIISAGHARIPDDRLKSILFDAVTIQPPPPYAGRPVIIHSIQQLEGPPIAFKVLTNQPKGLHFSYQRYLMNRLREDTPFEGWPMRLVLCSKK